MPIKKTILQNLKMKMLKKHGIIIFFLIILFPVSYGQCFGQEIKIDHVISVVSDINKAIDLYTEKGFTVKRGRLHKNGLINGHIKFTNKSSFELMSVMGEATDEISKNYKELLNNGEGGVYIALSGVSTDVMEKKLTDLKISYHIIRGKNWDYITFPKASGLEHFFFIDSHIAINDALNVLTHKNSSEKIKEVFVEGDNRVEYFLKVMGLKTQGESPGIEPGTGKRFFTDTGDIVVVPGKNLNERPRIKSITFEKKDTTESIRIEF